MIELGLDRITALLSALQNPQHHLKVIHVAGTNGKGSVCAYISSTLIASGYRTGTFNSPHFLEFHDCIRIDKEPLQRSEFDVFYKRVCDTGLQASPFEILTATALVIFQERNVDFAVIEVGMGGRLDATNVFEDPLICVFTSVGLDHTEFLGDTVEKIAFEKSGIIKNGTRAVVASEMNSDSVLSILKSQSKSCPFHVAPIATRIPESSLASVNVFQQNMTFPLVLKGDYQLANASTALYALKLLEGLDMGFVLSKEILETGFQSVQWPGRLDIFQTDRQTFIIDGAHNESAAVELEKVVAPYRIKSPKVVWILAFTSTKDMDSILKRLIQSQDTVIGTSFTQPEGMPWIQAKEPLEIQKVVTKLGVFENHVTHSIANAMSMTLESESETVVVCGSLYLVADWFRWAKNDTKFSLKKIH